MTERNRAAIDVDLLTIEIEITDKFLSHHRKGFVNFPQINIVFGQSCAIENFFGRRNRGVQHQRWIVAHIRRCHNSRPRL